MSASIELLLLLLGSVGLIVGLALIGSLLWYLSSKDLIKEVEEDIKNNRL